MDKTTCIPSETTHCACTFVFSEYGACSLEGIQTRTLISHTPENCVGVPAMYRTCTPPPSCKVFFEYAVTDPSIITVPTVASQPGCDQTGLEIALAVALSRLLRGP